MEALKIYEEYGVAALFIFLYVTTVWFLIHHLIKNQKQSREDAAQRIKEEIENTKEMVRVIERNSNQKEKELRMMREMKETIEEYANANHELLTYLKIREELGGKKR